MSVQDRPFIGTWKAEGITLVQHTPDAIVYVNGFTEVLGCPSCNGKIDIQKYVTSVSCDPNTEPVANATISLSIPSTAFRTDGSFFIHPGYEVTIYMRGYFARSLLTKEDTVEEIDPTGTPVYPYYQVFNGVVTEASYEYSGGEYTASITCSDVLHFWANLKMSTNGAVFGKRPPDALTEPTLVGHTFMGASPYSIIYTLFRVGFGAAGGVDFQLAKKTNIDATSEVSGLSSYKMASLWWEKRWASNSISLRMYGTDGKMFNASEQVYLGLFSGKKPDALKKVMDQNKDLYPYDKNSSARINKLIRDLGYNPLSTQIAVTISEDGKKKTRIDAAKQQAFNLDISALGNVNLFETEYMSKLDIVNAVRTITGYEFFQDVTGDIIFKPPFYNLDTSDDPVYVIEDRDLISLSQAEREPQATMIKGSGSHFNNVSGVGLDSWLGLGALYVDYRLVAQFGWREETFECNYLSDTRALFVSAMNRLDLVNVGSKSATISIPLRPELRPGYPVYIRSIDCYYYIQSLSHSYTAGGQCTTSINGVGKRGKFHAPGSATAGREPTIDDIDLSNPYLPEVPLTLRSGEVATRDEDVNLFQIGGPPRTQGFPNVVLAIDPTQVNPGSLVYLSKLNPDELIRSALNLGVLQISTNAIGNSEAERRLNGPYKVPEGDDISREISKDELTSAWPSVQTALREGKTFDEVTGLSEDMRFFFSAIQAARGVPDDENLVNYLILMNDTKAAFKPGAQVTGQYRYYSASHPSVTQQGSQPIYVNQATGELKNQNASPPDQLFETYGFYPAGQSSKYGPTNPAAGLSVIQFDNTADGGVTTIERIVGTQEIRFVTFTSHTVDAETTVQQEVTGLQYGAAYTQPSKGVLGDLLLKSFKNASGQTDKSLGVKDRYFSIFEEKYRAILVLWTQAVALSGDWPLTPFEQDYFDTSTGGYNAETLFGEALLAVKGADGNSVDPTKTVLLNFTGSGGALDAGAETRGEELILVSLSSTLAIMYESLLQLIYANFTSLGAAYWKPLYKQRDTYLTQVSTEAGANFTPPPIPIPKVKKTKGKTKTQPAYSPVFPVSDERGYEVVGSLPYGRGLNVETYEQLAEYAASVSKEGLTISVQTLLGGGAADLTTFRATEDFLFRYAAKGDVSKAIGSQNPQNAEAVASAVFAGDAALYSTNEKGVTAPTIPQDNIDAIRNIVATSNAQGQKTLASNVPIELSQISVDNPEDICSCALQSAQTYLEAANGAFQGVLGNAEIVEFLVSEAEPVTEAWASSREALGGKVLDRRNSNLAEEFSRNFDSGSPSFLGGGYSRAQSEVGNINDAVDRAEALFTSLTDEG